jgi:glycogen synthase
VGHRFLREVVEDHFPDLSIMTSGIRREIKEKYHHGSTLTILNAPSPSMYPENARNLIRNYGPGDDVLAVKRECLVEFQKRTGLNIDPDAILLYWPSRLDPVQKGIHLLEDIAHRFVIEHGDVQIAIIGDGVGQDRTHEEICGRIAWSSGGRIAYQRFDEPLSMLGFAAASDVFGASLYEPCGQIDQIGNLYGATATNRDTGGYSDKIRELALKADGAPEDAGNGFLFRDYDSGGLWYGLYRAVRFHRRPAWVREPQIRRIMRETRERHDLNRMVENYIRVYERLNGGVPLA